MAFPSSFDHLLGFLKQNNPEIDGLTGIESCPVNATDPSYGLLSFSDPPFVVPSKN